MVLKTMPLWHWPVVWLAWALPTILRRQRAARRPRCVHGDSWADCPECRRLG